MAKELESQELPETDMEVTDVVEQPVSVNMEEFARQIEEDLQVAEREVAEQEKVATAA